MAKNNDFREFEFLRQLTETPGIPGREERIRELILAETKGLWDETRVDAMGNLICLKRATRKSRGGQPKKVMLACHMDEIGFYVRFIDENGFLRLQNAGGFDTRNLFARNVLVQGKEDVVGVLNPAGKPIHLSTPEERNKIPEIKDFYVDLFMPKKQVEKLVEVGDPVTLVQQTRMIGDCISGKCMDNRVAVWVGINALRQVYGHDLITGEAKARGRGAVGSPYDIYFVASVQEEVGLRGATTAAYSVEPDVGIAIDTTLACDTPGVGKDEAVTEIGKGVAIKVMDSASISHRGLFEEFVALAKKKRIAHQREILPRGGTDAGAVQRARAGTKAITLSIPTRYVHTATESLNRKDAKAGVDLLAAWLAG
ncbi:MAG: M42 family peptidase [Phycisphaerae bacterium]|nr:M42 family peptidase [Phycisphaerae bacterium]